MWLFDLERLDVVTRLQGWFSLGAIVFVGLMVVCEAASHMLTEKKEQFLSRPRALSTRQFNRLVSGLRQAGRRKIAICSPRIREAEIFADQFLTAFKKAGWDAEIVVADIPEGHLDSGVLFMSYEGNTPPSNPDFSTLNEAFRFADIQFKDVSMRLSAPYTNGITTTDPVILIGKRFEY